MKTFSRDIVKYKANLQLDRDFRSGVSLHSHTMHSREWLGRLPSYIKRLPIISSIVEREVGRYHFYKGGTVNLRRAFWTPPLSPREALALEKQQIESVLGLRALVSLSDHDNIEAGKQLQVVPETCGVPVSVEWTAPYLQTCFHIGVHNLPRESASAWMAEFARQTASRDPMLLRKLLHELHGCPSVLVVLNHPFWSAEGVDPDVQRSSMLRFLEEYRNVVHALEINGMRPHRENRAASELAQAFDLPLISGGDRHGCDPNATLNLTGAGTFEEFVDEIRRDRYGKILLMPQYFEPLRLRFFVEAWHILGEAPGEFGRRRWTSRVFIITDDGVERPVSYLMGQDGPPWIRRIHWVVGLITKPWFRPATRLAMLTSGEEGL
jgi:hypothetical protein